MPPLVEYGSDSDAYEEPPQLRETLKATESSQDKAHIDEEAREGEGARENRGVARREARNDEEFRGEARKDGKRKNRGLRGDGFEGEVTLDEYEEHRDRGRSTSLREEAVGGTEGVQMGYRGGDGPLRDGWLSPSPRSTSHSIPGSPSHSNRASAAEVSPRLKRKASQDLSSGASRSGRTAASSPSVHERTDLAPRVTGAAGEVGPLIGPVLESASGDHSSSPGGELEETAAKLGRSRRVRENKVQNSGIPSSFPDYSDDYERANKLAEDLWDPALFPDQVIRDELKSHYHEVLRKRRTGDILPLELEEEDGEDEDDDEDRDEDRDESEYGGEGEGEDEDGDQDEGGEGEDEGEDEKMDGDERELYEAEKQKAEERIKHGREVLEGAMARVRKVVEEQQSLRVGMQQDTTRRRSSSASSDETGYAKEDRQWDLSWVLAAE